MLAFYISVLETEAERDKMIEIYEEYKLTFYKIAMNYTNSAQHAEDVVHNTFIAIIEQKEKYLALSGSDFLFSCVLIVKNKCIDLLRKMDRYADIPIEELEIYLESFELPIAEQVEKRLEYEILWKQLDRLDEISKIVLIYKYERGLTYREIGKTLGMTESHVQTRIYRAKEKLKKFYQEASDGK